MRKLIIDNIKPVCDDFWGNGAIYHGYAGMPDEAGRVYSEELCALEAKRASDMKLKIARTMYKWWAWDPKTNTWDWDNEIMTAFYKWLQRMKDGGITVALNTGWCSPGDINDTCWNGPTPFAVEGDWEQSKKNFGDWVSETVKQLIVKRGFTNIKIFVMFTEPQHYSGVLPEKHPYECWLEAVETAHNSLVRDGLRDKIKLMGPNEGSTITSEMLCWAAEHAKDYLDIYSSHTYQFANQIPKKYLIAGTRTVAMDVAGSRFCKTVSLKQNTDYILTIRILTSFVDDIAPDGYIYYGAFLDDGRNDIHKTIGSGPSTPVVKDSVYSINPSEIKAEEYTEFTLNFNSGDAESCVLGVFHDIKTDSASYCNFVELREIQSGTVIEVLNNNSFDSWSLIASVEASDDIYNEWYKWSKTGLQYVPNGMPYCFDEYNSTYNRDNSRDTHGADICMAAISLMNSGCQSSLLWTVFDQQWPNSHSTNNDSFVDGDHRCGVMPVLTRSLVPHKSYYAFSILSKYVDGEGTLVYEGFGENNVHTTMSVSQSGEITVVVVNNKSTCDEFTITFNKPLKNIKLNRHSFDPKICVPDETAKIIGVDKVFENITSCLSDKIAAYGVTVYTTHND
ncbi:MAG: hypothetical protein J6C29_04510 [Clostridia bacterium]|nr:hypothetical protein [Clostridia bacterium]